MERAKLKFTVIILLAVLNVILLGLVIHQRAQAQVYEEAGRIQALDYLTQNGITAEEETIPWASSLEDSRTDPARQELLSELTETEAWEIQTMRQPETLLVDFVAGLSDMGVTCHRIASVTEGYVHTVQGDRTVFTPVWTIVTDNGSYRLDCASGELKKY